MDQAVSALGVHDRAVDAFELGADEFCVDQLHHQDVNGRPHYWHCCSHDIFDHGVVLLAGYSQQRKQGVARHLVVCAESSIFEFEHAVGLETVGPSVVEISHEHAIRVEAIWPSVDLD